MQNYLQSLGLSIPNSQGGISSGPNQNMSPLVPVSKIETSIQSMQPKTTQENKKISLTEFYGKLDKLKELNPDTPDEEIYSSGVKIAIDKGYIVEGLDLNKELQSFDPQPEKQTFLGKLEEAGRYREQKIEDIKQSDANFFSKTLQTFGQQAGAFSDIVGAGVTSLASAITPDSVEEKVLNEVMDFMQKEGVQNIVKTAKEVYDILPENIQKNVEAIGNVGLGILDAVGVGAVLKLGKEGIKQGIKQAGKKTFITEGQKVKYIEKVSKNIDDALLEISQSKNAKIDIPKFKKAVSSIDTKGINTYEDLSGRFTDNIDTIIAKQDSILPKEKVYNVGKLTTKSKEGTITTNYVKTALDDMEKLYSRVGEIDNLERIKALKKSKLSVADINQIAREYNSQFGQKAFDKMGNAKFTDIGRSFETTRKGVKEISRNLLPDDTMKLLDSELSNLYRARELSDDMVNSVNNVFKRVKKRGIVGNLTVKAIDIIDTLSLGTLSTIGKEAFSRLLLKGGMGKATMDALSLQDELAKSLKIVKNASAKIQKAKDGAVISKIIEDMGEKLGISEALKSLDNELKTGPLGDKLSGMADKTATKVGAKINFIDNSKGTGISGKVDGLKYKETLNIQDKKELNYLSRILSESDIEKIKNGIMVNHRGELFSDRIKRNIISKPVKNVLDSLTPTGNVVSEYKAKERANSILSKNLTTLDKTSGKSPNDIITIYRGVSKKYKSINAGDFVTPNYELAKSYTGEGNILSKKVKYSDIIDDIEDPLGEEYLYIPKNMQKWE